MEEDKGSWRCLQLSRLVWGSGPPAQAEGWMGSSACFPPHSPFLPTPSPSPWALRGWERGGGPYLVAPCNPCRRGAGIWQAQKTLGGGSGGP